MSSAETHLHEQAKEHVIMSSAVKASPGVAVSGAHFMGYPMPDVVMILTALYLCLQIGYLVWKWHKEAKAKRRVKK